MSCKILITFIAAIFFIAIGCKKLVNPRVKYFVNGTSSTYNVTYKDASGSIIEVDSVPYNWSNSFEGAKGDNLFISATANEPDCWSKVYIYIDGKLLGSDYQFGDNPTATVAKKLSLVF